MKDVRLFATVDNPLHAGQLGLLMRCPWRVATENLAEGQPAYTPQEASGTAAPRIAAIRLPAELKQAKKPKGKKFRARRRRRRK